jgi:hypothetical protein
MRRVAAAIFLAGALPACVFPQGLRSEHFLTGAAAAPRQGPVAIYMEGQPPPTSFEEVAVVSATGTGSHATLREVLGALQAEAASLGADAVMRVRYDRGSTEATATGVAVRVR